MAVTVLVSGGGGAAAISTIKALRMGGFDGRIVSTDAERLSAGLYLAATSEERRLLNLVIGAFMLSVAAMVVLGQRRSVSTWRRTELRGRPAWALALVVTGLIAAWRSVAMTFEAERVASLAGRVRSRDEREATGAEGGSGPEGGTFGAPTGRRPGDWSADDRGGSL